MDLNCWNYRVIETQTETIFAKVHYIISNGVAVPVAWEPIQDEWIEWLKQGSPLGIIRAMWTDLDDPIYTVECLLGAMAGTWLKVGVDGKFI